MIRVLFLGALVLALEASQDNTCSSTKKSSIQFTVTSTVKQSGKRSVSTQLLSEDPGKAPVIMFVDHWTTSCGDVETLGLNVAIDDENGPRDPSAREPEWERLTETEEPTETEPPTTTAETEAPTTTTQAPTTTTTTLPPTTSIPRRPDYILAPGVGYYKVHRTEVTMPEARRTCQAEGADLIFPNTRAELDAVTPIWSRAGLNSYFWIGMTKIGNTWTLLNGQPLSSSNFQYWYPLQPSGDGTCSEIFISTKNMNDLDCTAHKRPFICELSL